MFVLFSSNVLVCFILFYYILSYYYPLKSCLFFFLMRNRKGVDQDRRGSREKVEEYGIGKLIRL